MKKFTRIETPGVEFPELSGLCAVLNATVREETKWERPDINSPDLEKSCGQRTCTIHGCLTPVGIMTIGQHPVVHFLSEDWWFESLAVDETTSALCTIQLREFCAVTLPNDNQGRGQRRLA